MMFDFSGLLLNHLWQSTVFGLITAFMAVALRKYRPAVRYWLWLAASLKFLFPLALLVDLGGRFRLHDTIVLPIAQNVGQAILTPAFAATALPVYTAPTSAHVSLLPLAVATLWSLGSAALAFGWVHEWRAIRTLVRSATPLDLGLPIRAVSCNSRMELGVFGILCPVLIVPVGLLECVSREQLSAILAHEMCHVQRRDNLWAALHQLAKAIFWFHPLIWWAGARMAAERESACDEHVVAHGGQPREYAEGILRVCQFYARGPACVAGISGSNLKRRVLAIAEDAFGNGMGLRMKSLLTGLAALFLFLPLALGALNANVLMGTVPTQSVIVSLPAFDAVSIKPFHFTGQPWRRRAQFDPQRLYIEGMAPIELILLAYSLNQNQLTGLPDWARFSHTNLYSITATTDKPASRDQMLLMLRRVLAERFQLKVEESDKTVPVWALVVPPGGPKFKPIAPNENCQSGVISSDDMKKAGAPPQSLGYFHGCSVADLVRAFNGGRNPAELGRPVVDKTGLTGRYDLTVWLTYGGSGFRVSDLEPFREAVQRELGLSLTNATAPYRVVRVVSIARPGPDK